jgi:hypothetical protein
MIYLGTWGGTKQTIRSIFFDPLSPCASTQIPKTLRLNPLAPEETDHSVYPAERVSSKKRESPANAGLVDSRKGVSDRRIGFGNLSDRSFFHKVIKPTLGPRRFVQMDDALGCRLIQKLR